MTKGSLHVKIEGIIGTIRIPEIGTMLEMIGIELNIIEVIEEMLRIDIRGRFSRNRKRVDVGIEVDPPLMIKVKREDIIIVENQDIL